MNKRSIYFAMIFSSILGGLIAIGGYQLVAPDKVEYIPVTEKSPVSFTNYSFDSSKFVVPEGLNFVFAAKSATNSVVHIRTKISESARTSTSPFDDFYRDFFGQPDNRGGRPSMGMGSGVIVRDDGYIVTNNHVIDGASEVEVMLNDNRTYEAEIVGVDPTTDIAVLKVEDVGLPVMKWGNSDDLNLGEWVLAVGNPFQFRSTVTAGIVSAKARNINILARNNNDLQIESFIQTDAAVNPGNSGGGLVNLNGELVGINTAIISPTGAFAGYSFAVPVSLVRKVYEDLVEFGTVQRALLGIRIVDVNADLAERENLDVIRGIYVALVNPNSAADDAGIREGDVIVGVEGRSVNTTSELQELVALNRPGDEVEITYVRDGSTRKVLTTLKNSRNSVDIILTEVENLTIEGVTFENVSEDDFDNLNVSGGIKVVEVRSGKFREAGIRNGFIITKINKTEVDDIDEFKGYLERSRGEGILLEGFYPNGEKAYYGIGW